MPKKTNINKFKDIKVKLDFEKIIKKNANKTVKILQQPNVSPRSNRANRKNPYWQGWTAVSMKIYDGAKYIVWNKTNWQLTHLLENGHFITNSKDGKIPWVAPQPHIRPTFEKIKPKFIKEMKNVDIDVEIK